MISKSHFDGGRTAFSRTLSIERLIGMYRCVHDSNFTSLLMVSMEEIASNTLFLLLFLSE